ncbi:MAG: hypothetical protein ACLFN5_01875, partial [bacterium]
MRKKIFIIHGMGIKDGLGRNSGGDLDTVGSNAFYGAWMKQQVEGEPEYGKDYEFDFVNYQEGLRHLDIHAGCDVYLPDFPIDALAPRLEMRRIRREEEIDVRCELFEEFEAVRKTVYSAPGAFTEEWKKAYNDLMKNLDKVKNDRKYFEIKMARHYTGLLAGAVDQIKQDGGVGDVMKMLEDKLIGDEYDNLMSDVQKLLDTSLKRDIVDEISQEHVEERLLVDDSSRFDFSCRGRLGWCHQLMAIWVEVVSIYVSTCFLISNVRDVLSEEDAAALLDWAEKLKKRVGDYNDELEGFLEQVIESNPDNKNAQKMLANMREVYEFWNKLSYDWIVENYNPLEGQLAVQVTESTGGRPVSDLEVVFNVSEGPVSLAPVNDPENKVQSISLATDERGTARVCFHRPEDCEDYGVTVTHNDLDFLTFPEDLVLSEKYFEEHPDPDSIELSLVEYLGGSQNKVESQGLSEEELEEKIEESETALARRAIDVQTGLIESDIRYLADNDVRLVRIDDHHPYTPEILQTLQNLKEEGLIEEIVLSSLPRGEHLPLEKQKCGADLIYEQFVKDTPADNPGLARLRDEAHYQDLHIKESHLAIELSKLIGSKYDKIEMVRNLMELQTKKDMDNIMEDTGWADRVAEYEAGLDKVLPRVEKTLYHIKMIDPPEDGDYSSEVGFKKFLHPFEFLFGNKAQKEQLQKQLYAREADAGVDIYSAISPFCNPRMGEPTINVASALNYLTKRYEMDFYFYAYGSFLFSTRRVNEESYDIDLSYLVSKIGSPADGGHASAATGSPENNPSFPANRFSRVSHENFAEYLYYITDIVADATGLELLEIEEQFPDELEDGMQELFNQLDRNVFNLKLAGPEGVANICFSKGVYSGQGKPNMTMPLALAYLKQSHPMDYFFYSVSPAKLVMRNVRDYKQILDLDEVARCLGTFRDGGDPRAAICQPRFSPKFDEGSFKYVNYKNIGNYVKFLGQR